MLRAPLLLACSLALLTAPARADWDLGAALRAFGAGRAIDPPRALFVRDRAHVAWVVESAGESAPPGAIPIHEGFSVLYTDAPGVRALFAEGSRRAYWSPGRRLLLDRADGWTRASAMRRQAGVTGRGVVIGLIDSGVDVLHPDLRNADGSTRVRWLVDFTRPMFGRHPELEAEYGCADDRSPCAVYSAADIDALIANDRVGDEPRDSFGHGTHVASLAAGNGLGSEPVKYLGVAPEADLVIARVVQGTSSILDAEILRAARFVFERARAAGAPAVLNLSLGSDYGAHDGSSALERALSSFVGADEPGRAIVVAAGNSAGLYAGNTGSVQGPLGVHTELHVPYHSPVSVPIVTSSDTLTIRGAIYLWLRFRQGDRVAVALTRNGDDWISEVGPGHGNAAASGDVQATLLNGVDGSESRLGTNEHSAVVVIEGSWPASTRFALRFAGHGTASLWVQSDGDLDPALGIGAVLPYATKEATINVPASAPALIAVGATLNRTEWQDYLGETIVKPAQGALDVAPPDTTAYFSSAGPNALGMLKPDIVAPGANVIGAMSALVDPRQGGLGGLFAGGGQCAGSTPCLVVDDNHAVSSGTSMAAPIVAGAIALLFERDPSLTQDAVRALLQAGARPLEGAIFTEQQTGTGALDLEGTLAAQIAESTPVERAPGKRSWLGLAASRARPDETWPLEGYLELRDDDGALADGFDARRLELSVENGRLAAPLARVAPGLYRFSILTSARTGGTTLVLRASFDGEQFLSRELPIAVDAGAATGAVTPRGGCAFGGSRGNAGLSALALLALFQRRRQSRAR